MIKLHNDPARTTPLGMARYSYEFLEAGFTLDKTVGRQEGYELVASIPVLYLLGHGIELAFKAYLLQHEIMLKELKGFKHNLSDCFDKANAFGLSDIVSFEQSEIEVLKILDELYSSKQLEYIVTGAKEFPLFGPLESFAVKLFNAVSGSVGFRQNFKATFTVN